MRLQQSIPLSDIYRREEDFSDDLATTLHALKVGNFEEVETESRVGTREADIVADGADGTLVIENQFGKADWDHWGRLEAYARLKEATVAALVAEDFEDLMKVTCDLRNQDSEIDWYLIQAQANECHAFSFHHVVKPAIDIQAEKKADAEHSEFWEPIRAGDGLFAGKPVPRRTEHRVIKRVRGVRLILRLLNHHCDVQLLFKEENGLGRRDEIVQLFQELEYDCQPEETPNNYPSIVFPVLDKGKKDRDDWPEIREKLVGMGTDIYNRINESDA